MLPVRVRLDKPRPRPPGHSLTLARAGYRPVSAATVEGTAVMPAAGGCRAAVVPLGAANDPGAAAAAVRALALAAGLVFVRGGLPCWAGSAAPGFVLEKPLAEAALVEAVLAAAG